MMNIEAGEFWVADILFTNATSSKKRPVLILWIEGEISVKNIFILNFETKDYL